MLALCTDCFLAGPLLWTGFATRLHFTPWMILILGGEILMGGGVGFLTGLKDPPSRRVLGAWGAALGLAAVWNAVVLVVSTYPLPPDIASPEYSAMLPCIFPAAFGDAMLSGLLFWRVAMAATALVGWSRRRAVLTAVAALLLSVVPMTSGIENAIL